MGPDAEAAAAEETGTPQSAEDSWTPPIDESGLWVCPDLDDDEVELNSDVQAWVEPHVNSAEMRRPMMDWHFLLQRVARDAVRYRRSLMMRRKEEESMAKVIHQLTT